MTQPNLHEIIWQVVANIPEGKVATYGQIAKIAGYTSYARFVGATLRNLPKNTELPWHRVINAQGRISFPYGSEAYKRQQSLLESEGIVFVNSKISLREYAWDNSVRRI